MGSKWYQLSSSLQKSRNLWSFREDFKYFESRQGHNQAKLCLILM